MCFEKIGVQEPVTALVLRASEPRTSLECGDLAPLWYSGANAILPLSCTRLQTNVIDTRFSFCAASEPLQGGARFGGPLYQSGARSPHSKEVRGSEARCTKAVPGHRTPRRCAVRRPAVPKRCQVPALQGGARFGARCTKAVSGPRTPRRHPISPETRRYW
jgi:hypothetical protein